MVPLRYIAAINNTLQRVVRYFALGLLKSQYDPFSYSVCWLLFGQTSSGQIGKFVTLSRWPECILRLILQIYRVCHAKSPMSLDPMFIYI